MNMDLNYERKLQLNEWLISARWFYMVAVFLIGLLSNVLFGIFSVKLSFFPLAILLLIFIGVNAYFVYIIGQIKKTQAYEKLKILSLFQIAVELIIFTVIMYFGGDKTLASIFFFLPIISASMIYGIKGALITAVASGLLVNIPVTWEYFIYVWYNIFGQKSFNISDFTQFNLKSINLIKIVTTSNFYLVIAVFSGYSSRLLFKREKDLLLQAEEVTKVKEYRENELRQLDKTTKLLVKRDRQLMVINKELDKKIQELELSEKSMLKAFFDLKSERKKSEIERNKVEAIIANFIDPILMIDVNGKISLVNPAAKNIFGLSDLNIGQKISDSNNYSMNNFKDSIKQKYTVKKGKISDPNRQEEEVIVENNEQKLTYKVNTAKVLNKDRAILGTMKIFYNLTREKMIDKLKSEFISIAAHQLRTPLSAIKWVIKMILDGDLGELNEEQQKLLFKGYQSNERIIELVNDMLNVSRIEEGRFGYSFKSSNFKEIFDIVLESLKPKIDNKNIKLLINTPKKIPNIYMDSQKMLLVLQNLFENAVKYTPEHGKIEIKVEAAKQFIKFKIKDNGVGIPSEEQPKLFTKFFRANNVMRMQTEGSGLGLFIVKNVIKRHGGEITFSSVEGKGAEFVFTLPIE
ncbi:MAG: ATP-binding protein [Patescibacteria group bacterium]|nr:ATP-binding protein [Patescibacteria group bacterium]